MALRDTFAKRSAKVSTKVSRQASSPSAQRGWMSRSALVAALGLGWVLAAIFMLTANAHSNSGSGEGNGSGHTASGAATSIVALSRYAYNDYRDESVNIKYPKSWSFQTKANKSHCAKALNGQVDISWSTTRLRSGVDLKTFSQAIVDRLVSLRAKQMFVERVISDTNETINGTAVRKVMVECTVEVKGGSTYKIQQLMVLGVSRGNALILTCTAATEHFEALQPVFDDVLHSISM